MRRMRSIRASGMRISESTSASFRVKKFPKGRQRTCSVGRLTSTDFRNWTMANVVFAADARDEAAPVPGGAPDWRPPVDFYVPGGMKVPGVARAYILLPNAYYHWAENAFPSTLDVRLATSRDTVNWWQHPAREPFLRLGADGTRSAGMVCANPWLIPVGDEIWLYYAGIGVDHHLVRAADRSPSAIFHARLRQDGFISVDRILRRRRVHHPADDVRRQPSRAQPGRQRRRLAAGLRSSPQTANPLRCTSWQHPTCCEANSTAKIVTWGGEQDLSALAGKPVRLRFVMRSMKLFAFQFVAWSTL